MTTLDAPSARSARGNAPRLGAVAATVLLVLAAAACTGGAGASPGVIVPGTSAKPTLAPAPSDPPTGSPATEPGDDAIPPAIVDAAIADAAARAGVDPSTVTVVSTEAKDWPNGALGCPEPGMMYTEVITPGYRVVVDAGGTLYDYRASTRSPDVHLCENPGGG